ncbi:Hypp6331 [Branchiostoma lanceolatum]|uniref:Hypp6331 protein n=1 Tax=Branchiostoma lanceolatum TaxID=7740 RepID=A0A8J9YT22_BRALA|nr:Hypp6331 [Branchiostoma lanceolatum]
MSTTQSTTASPTSGWTWRVHVDGTVGAAEIAAIACTGFILLSFLATLLLDVLQTRKQTQVKKASVIAPGPRWYRDG